MAEADLDAVSAMEKASFRRPWSRKAFADEMIQEYSRNLVLKLENSSKTYQIIGYLCYRVISGEAHILKFAVHPEFRRKGRGFCFLRHCLSAMAADGIASVMLEVRESNAAAIGIYEKAGFAVEARLPAYYPDTREDVILMRKNFLKEE